ncbi:unnamed protein product [Cunninghamella blakesleeana]
MNNSTPTSGMMDPTCINVSDMDTLFKPMETDLFQQLYLAMTNHENDHPPSGLMTPMENDWHQFDLLDPNQHGDTSSIQDMFLTSPNSMNDNTILTPSSSPEALFNSLIVDPTTTSPLFTSSSQFHQDLITCQDISTLSTPPPTTTTTLNDVIEKIQMNNNNNNNNNNNEMKKKQKVVHPTTKSSSPLEMMLTLDTPLKTSSSKVSKDKSKKKITPPVASLPVTSHIMSASTPTFTLKQINGNNKKRNHSTVSSSSSSSSSIILNNKKDSSSSSMNTNTTVTKMINKEDTEMISSSSDNTNIPVELALKRQRNTDAARRSRLRKVQKMESLSSRVNELETIHQQLLIRLATLETDKSILLKNEANYQSRIEQLESELTNAHVKLAQF